MLMRCNPIVSILCEGVYVKGCQVKEGQEHELFKATCAEIMTQEVDIPWGQKFKCTLGIGPESVQLRHLKRLD